MKRALLKDSVKEIKNTYKRFISILLMAFLGVGFFAGLRAASPDMIDTIDQFYEDNQVYDIQILSTLGLTEADIEELAKVDEVDKVTGSYETDGLIEIENKEIVTKLITIGEINQPILLEGSLPQNADECVVEESFLKSNNKQIGDMIEVEVEETTNDNGDKTAYLKNSQMKIVGTVQSPLYISRDRGTSKLGAGKINYYMYIPKENVNANEVYTSIYIKVKNEEKYETSSKKYEDYIEQVKDNVEQIKEQREQARKTQLVEIANQKITEAENELNIQKQDAKIKINDAEKKLQDARNKISSGEAEIASNKKKADNQFANAQKEIDNAMAQLQAKEQELNQQEEQTNAQFGQMRMENPYLQEIQNGRAQIEQTKLQLDQQEKELNSTKTQTYAQIEQAQNEINDAKTELQNGEKELEDNKAEFNQKIADAEKELQEAKDKVNDIENPKWYILDRNSNEGYVGFIQATKSIANISKVFPIVFFAVAALISLTSMTRMVEEQRTQIGTLKALGYNQLQIISKYILYASLASIIGGVAGMCVGFATLPQIIWMLYMMMYQITPKIILSFNWKYGGLGLLLICICIIGATIYSAVRELKETPAVLMRPKAPKAGNRVLLERIPFIWKHLNFSHKVTVRNIFRYKKRFLMTIIGIFGCTSLIVTGFGIKDSISIIIPNQFEKVFDYDMQVNIKDTLSEEEKQNFITELGNREEVQKIVETYMTSATAVNGDSEEDIQIIVQKDNFDGLINVNDLKTKENIELKDNEICLTDKCAQLIGVKAGDTIILKDSDNNEVEVKISNIVENYVSHYVYMSKTTYENLYGESYSTNVILLQNSNLTEEEEDSFVTELMKKTEVASASRISTMMGALDDTLKSLDYVVIILIVSAGLLAFVVLYNLANVNISERIRELATIKVLGFYDKEVYDYVTRETIILTIIGIILGLFGGYCLNYYLIGTCEINILRFSKIVNPISFVYATLITIVFTLIVNIFTYFALKKIDMIESLKSVE